MNKKLTQEKARELILAFRKQNLEMYSKKKRNALLIGGTVLVVTTIGVWLIFQMPIGDARSNIGEWFLILASIMFLLCLTQYNFSKMVCKASRQEIEKIESEPTPDPAEDYVMKALQLNLWNDEE